MASLHALPIEILEKIVENIPERPFPTGLLQLNKTLCSVFMNEQVRNLELNRQQADRWNKIITRTNVKDPLSPLRYCNLLDKIFRLTIHIRQIASIEMVAGFIGSCVNLRKFVLRRSLPTINHWDISPIIDSLPPSIVELRFSGLSIGNGEENIASLASYARRSTKLERLYFNHFNISQEAIQAMGNFLGPNMSEFKTATITELSFTESGIGDEGVRTLIFYLKENKSVISLSLLGNGIGDEGASALAECLALNKTLTNLDLCTNRIADEGARALAECLKENTGLTNLNLSSNRVGDEGARALAECLKENTGLANLNLSWNCINSNGVHALAEGRKQNAARSLMLGKPAFKLNL